MALRERRRGPPIVATVGIPTPEKISFAAGTFEMFDVADLSNEPA
jgi:hypothetical protein